MLNRNWEQRQNVLYCNAIFFFISLWILFYFFCCTHFTFFFSFKVSFSFFVENNGQTLCNRNREQNYEQNEKKKWNEKLNMVLKQKTYNRLSAMPSKVKGACALNAPVHFDRHCYMLLCTWRYLCLPVYTDVDPTSQLIDHFIFTSIVLFVFSLILFNLIFISS